MQIHHKLIGVMHSNDRLLRTVYKISVDKGFLTFLINHLLVLKFCLEIGGKHTYQQKCWDFSIPEVLF